MWLDEQREGIRNHAEPTIFVAPLRYGAAHIIATFGQKTEPLIWLELTESDRDDPIAQGNKLVDAVKRALGSPLIPPALPFQYAVHFLKSNLPLLGPLTFAVTNAEHGIEFASSLLELNDEDNRVVLAFNMLPPSFRLPEHARILGPDELRLSKIQALEQAGEHLADAEAMALWQESEGAYSTFLASLHARLSLPLPPRPSPQGPHLPPGHEIFVEPEKLLGVLVRKGRWIEALDLATQHLPHAIPDLLEEAGHAYHEQGLHKRLWQLLSRLPQQINDEEIVLRWRLVAAARLGQTKKMRPSVERYLTEHEAPLLRATYAATLRSPELREAEAQRACDTDRNPLTLFQCGRLTRDMHRRGELLQEAVTMAETHGHPYEAARNAGALASHLIHEGQYRDAAHWSGWALALFNRHGLADGQRHLTLLNDWAYARLLIGDTVGLREPLQEAEPHIELAYPELARLFRSTLGDYLLATGRPAEALSYYRVNLESAPRHEIGLAALDMTRVLLEVSESASALECAEHAYVLTERDGASYHLPAKLALAMALTFENRGRAARLLDDLLETRSLSARYLAQASLHRAYVAFVDGHIQAAKHVLDGATSALAELSPTGLRLLSGPEPSFRPIWHLCLGRGSPLELKLLGSFEAWYEGELVTVPPQWGEILAILTLIQDMESLTLEQLHAKLSGEQGQPSNLKAAVSKMRRKLPVSHHPYRLTTPFSTDVQEVTRLLSAGQLREALALYRGPLLPHSDAPAIRQARETLEESLRQAALQSDDPKIVIALAEQLGNDLELWQYAERILRDEDSRAPMVRARIRQVLHAWEM